MLDILLNAPRPIMVGGKQYLISNLKLIELARLQRWIRDNGLSPVKALREVIDLMPEGERAKAAERAAQETRRDWPPAIGSTEGNAILLGSPDGQLEFLRVMLSKHQPLTDADLAAAASAIGPEDFGVLVAIAFGEDDLDPEQVRTLARERLAALAALQEAYVQAVAEESDSASSSPTSGAEDAVSSPPSSESSPSTSSSCSPTTASSPDPSAPH